ncbi:MAG: hypothetical protein ORN50_01465, partial [Crocinitomicaceae bacterium]|nr:hypothetical protein [Crocinitomicaceae bacterium]
MKIPFTFARNHEVLLLEKANELPMLYWSDKTKPSILHEISRNMGLLQYAKKGSEEILLLISKEYAQNESDAAKVVDELED